jgi:hypothetical protein
MDHHETVVADSSVKPLPLKDHASGGILADGWTVIDPCVPGITKCNVTVSFRPAFTSTGTARSHTGPSAPKATGAPAAPVA